jgi:enoyl-CoA hydratase/carnithine racemase
MNYIFSHRFKDTLVNTVGHRQSEHLLCLGKMVSTADAGDIGLVDRMVEKSNLMAEAKDEIQKWLAIPGTKFILCAFIEWDNSELVTTCEQVRI